MPVGTNVAGTAFAYTSGDIFLDPAQRLEDVQFELRSYALQYIRSFQMLGKSARFDVSQTYQSGTWTGLLDGVPATAKREGWSDTMLRYSINLLGAPPLSGRPYVEYRTGRERETIVAAGLIVQLPTGQYDSTKLVNLGSNRYTFRPQLGIVRVRGKWSFEATAAIWIYTDNDAYYAGTRLEQDSSLGLDVHLVYSFRPGFWIAGGAGVLWGEGTTVNGLSSHNSKQNYGWGIALGIPLTRAIGLKLGYVGTRTGVDTGADTDTFSATGSVLW